jgi:Protein of unknown function (DUF1566)
LANLVNENVASIINESQYCMSTTTMKGRETMKRLLSYAACIIALGIAPISSTALAQTTAPGPYYAIPSWDQTLPSNTRFIVLSNMGSAAVLDRETGLVWERVPATTPRSFPDAQEVCYMKNVGSRRGWRPPTIEQLASLVDPAATSAPFLPAGHPFEIQPTIYWSSTSLATVADSVGFRVNFNTGQVVQGNKGGSNLALAWCVRGGNGHDGQ